jgi:hypothetical protein
MDGEVCSLRERLSSPVDVVCCVWKLEAIETLIKSKIERQQELSCHKNWLARRPAKIAVGPERHGSAPYHYCCGMWRTKADH